MVRRLSDGRLFVGEVVDEIKEEEPEIMGDQFLTEETTEDIPEPIAETPAEKKPVRKTATTAKRKNSGNSKRK